MPTRRLCLLALALAVGACDMPADPVPTNRYDPLFDGVRTGSTPEEFGLDASTPTSFTLGWLDTSAFETGYRIERRVDVPGRAGRFEIETLARVGPDVTAYVWEGLDLSDQVLRLVLEVEGEVEGDPTDWIRVAYPVIQTPLPSGTDVLLTADGRLALARESGGVTAYDAETGERLAAFPFDRVLLAGGDRFVGYDGLGSQTYTAVEGTDVVATVTFDCRCEDYFAADATGRRVVAVRGDVLELLDLTDGSASRRTLAALGGVAYEPLEFVGPYLLFQEDGAESRLVLDLQAGAVVWRTSEGGWDDASGALMPDGQTLMTSRNGRATLVDLATGEVLRAGTAPTGRVVSVSADGASFVFGSSPGIGIGSTETLAPIRTLLPPGIRSARALADGEAVRGVRVSDDRQSVSVEDVRLDAVWEQAASVE